MPPLGGTIRVFRCQFLRMIHAFVDLIKDAPLSEAWQSLLEWDRLCLSLSASNLPLRFPQCPGDPAGAHRIVGAHRVMWVNCLVLTAQALF